MTALLFINDHRQGWFRLVLQSLIFYRFRVNR